MLLDAGSYLRARRLRRIYQGEMLRLFEGCDLLISPGAKDTAPEGLGYTGDPGFSGPWTLADPAGKLVDRSMPNAEREALRLHPLLGSTVVGSEAAAPQSFMLRFDNGYVLAASRYSRAYRSFSIHPDFEPKPGGA